MYEKLLRWFCCYLIVSLLFLCSCAQEGKICKRRVEDPDRLCTKEELTFIDNWNGIAKRINDFDINSFKENFVTSNEGNYKQPRIALLGELHDHIDGMIENYGYINYLAKDRRVNVLEEGANFAEKKDTSSFLKLSRIIELILRKELADEGVVFKPGVWDKMAARRYPAAVEKFFSSIKHLVVPHNLKNLEFSYWDKRDNDEKEKLTYDEFIDRNKSLVEAINYRQLSEPDVPVVAIVGLVHMPLGEYFLITNKIPFLALSFPPDFPKYYVNADNLRLKLEKERPLTYYEEWLGTTKKIFESLSVMNNAIQVIPRTVLLRI